MKTIAFVIPYFGKFNNYFPLFLESCRYNPTIDWIIFTDDNSNYNYPSNVHIHYTTLSETKLLFEQKLGEKIYLGHAYKLCDFKPFYGAIYDEYLINYDFWGYCDVDLIWGDIRSFINDHILLNNVRLFRYGHCVLTKNEMPYNFAFKNRVDGVLDYKRVIKSRLNCFYDENNNIDKIFSVLWPNSFYQEKHFYDVDVYHKLFLPAASMGGVSNMSIFCFNKGKLFGLSMMEGTILKKEYLYVHLQKRKMENFVSDEKNGFLIIPNKFIPIKDVDASNFASFLPRSRFYWDAKKMILERYIDAIFNNKRPQTLVRGKLKKIFDVLFNRTIEF